MSFLSTKPFEKQPLREPFKPFTQNFASAGDHHEGLGIDLGNQFF